MYSGISGMKNFQTKLDVIGNNIANVNTFGFKKGRATFSDLVNQNIQGAKASGGGIGGINPKQIGLGSSNSTIDTIHTQGSVQYTNRPLDLAISGDGFFVVSDGANDFYTRAGNFYLDGNGTLVNSDGLTLKPNINIPDDAQSFSIDPTGAVSYINNAGALIPVDTLQIAKFANPGALEKQGGNLFAETTNSGAANIVDAAGEEGTGKLIIGGLEMSNVDLSEEFTEMITAQRGFQANTKIITTSDEILQELVNLKR